MEKVQGSSPPKLVPLRLPRQRLAVLGVRDVVSDKVADEEHWAEDGQHDGSRGHARGDGVVHLHLDICAVVGARDIVGRRVLRSVLGRVHEDALRGHGIEWALHAFPGAHVAVVAHHPHHQEEGGGWHGTIAELVHKLARQALVVGNSDGRGVEGGRHVKVLDVEGAVGGQLRASRGVQVQ